VNWNVIRGFAIVLILSGRPSAEAAPFVIDAEAQVSYDVSCPRESLRAFDRPEFISRNLPGLKGITPKGDDLALWHLEIPVPMSRPMRGSFLTRRRVIGDNRIVYESADPAAEDTMICQTSVSPVSEKVSSVRISIRLRFSRSNGWKFHWLAPVFGQKFISARVKERLDKMLSEFVDNSKREWEDSGCG
jgi:hypothetical protein